MGNDILNIIGNVVKKGVKMEITKRTVVKNGYSPEANFKKSDMLIRSKYSASLLENQLLSVSLANCRELNGRLMAVLNKSQIIKLFNVSYHDFYSSLKTSFILSKKPFFSFPSAIRFFLHFTSYASSSFSIRLTETSADTPFSCMVIP